MEFFKNWLTKNSEANKKAINRLENPDATNRTEMRAGPSKDATNENEPKAGTSRQIGGDESTSGQPNNPSDLVYEDDVMKLIVQKGFHQHQKIFKLQVSLLLSSSVL